MLFKSYLELTSQPTIFFRKPTPSVLKFNFSRAEYKLFNTFLGIKILFNLLEKLTSLVRNFLEYKNLEFKISFLTFVIFFLAKYFEIISLFIKLI